MGIDLDGLGLGFFKIQDPQGRIKTQTGQGQTVLILGHGVWEQSKGWVRKSMTGSSVHLQLRA
jgi:hypothetical protein